MPFTNTNTSLRVHVCTSTTRPPTPFVGQQIYESNTTYWYSYNGTSWVQQFITGTVGASGSVGLTGAAGVTGATGGIGVTGASGLTGNAGSTGVTGATGSYGSGAISVYSVSGNANVAGTGNASYHPSGIYSTGSNWLYGLMLLNGNNIGSSGSTAHGAAQFYASDWFRSWGDSGLYNQTYNGGMYMTDSSWIRVYPGRNFYCDAEIRVGGLLSGNAGRSRGSYGSITLGGNGITNTWDGISFASPQTFMVNSDGNSGMFVEGVQWNWWFQYDWLFIGSDARYKREIEPLTLGLNFIKALKPISYLKLTEAPDDDPEATQEGYYYGFTAQNVREALDLVGETRDVKIHDIGGPNMGLVACTEDAVYDRQYIGITEFISPIVQSLKEISVRVKALEGAI